MRKAAGEGTERNVGFRCRLWVPGDLKQRQGVKSIKSERNRPVGVTGMPVPVGEWRALWELRNATWAVAPRGSEKPPQASASSSSCVHGWSMCEHGMCMAETGRLSGVGGARGPLINAIFFGPQGVLF